MSLNFTVDLFVMAMKKDAKLEEELTCRFKIDMKTWVLTRALENLKYLHFNGCTSRGSFWSNYIMFELKIYKGVIFDGTEEWSKIWGKLICAF